jgi:predicted RNase H-like HicB family nuclease
MRSSSLRRRKQHIKNPAKGRIPMKHLVEFPLEEGGSIVVEVDEPETSGTARAARGDALAKARETLEDALDKVLPAAKSVIEKLRSLDDKPNEIEVTFGIKLNTSLGAVIASATAEANFDITLRWTGNTKEKAP